MRSLIRKHLLRDRPTIELGGAIGVVACTTNRLLEHRSQHLVVEANPELIPLLSANKKANEAQFEIVEAAIAYGMDVVTFFQHPKNLLGGNVHRPTNRRVTVKTTTLAALLAMTGYEDINLIVDIECAEIPLIGHEADTIQKHVRMLFLEMHPVSTSETMREEARRRLEESGFEEIDRIEHVYAYKKK